MPLTVTLVWSPVTLLDWGSDPPTGREDFGVGTPSNAAYHQTTLALVTRVVSFPEK